MNRELVVIFCTLVPGLLSPKAGRDFAIKDGDTVVFLGDSIAAARTYGKIIEAYSEGLQRNMAQPFPYHFEVLPKASPGGASPRRIVNFDSFTTGAPRQGGRRPRPAQAIPSGK